MTATVHLGFEVGTGAAVAIPVGHMVVTGQSQAAGKTTTLEALVERSNVQAVAFVTKRGEGAFSGGHRINPYFRERADWRFVESIIESAMRQKMRFERAWIVRASKNAKSLADVRRNVQKLQEKSTRGMDADIYMLLGEYLELVVPLIEKLPTTTHLNLRKGLNVMDLGPYPTELQMLVIQSVLEWVYENEQDTVVVIPEAWEFVPQTRGSPVKLAATSLVRKGANLHNFVWLDSQDIAGVEKEILRQAPVWLLGVQREANEIKRTLDHIPAGIKKPRAADIATLERGQFFACWGTHAVKTYVQPAWLPEEEAQNCASNGPGPLTFQRWEKTRTTARPEKMPDPSPTPTTQPQEDDMTPAQEKKIDKLIDAVAGLSGAVTGQIQREARRDAEPNPRADRPGAEMFAESALQYEEALYQRFVARLREEAPAVIKVLTVQNEINVTVERREIQADGSTLPGRIALLVATGFFDQPKKGFAAFTELTRIGKTPDKPGTYREVKKLLELGFLTVNAEDEYQAVPGMKVNIHKAK